MRVVTVAVFLSALVACTGGGTTAATCGPQECAAVCAQTPAAASGGSMSAFEKGILDPMLDDVRSGIQPWDDKSVGVCKGSGRDCDEWLGTDALNLPPGDYLLRAELRVPNAGPKGTWKVRFDTECTTTRATSSGDQSTTTTSSKDYDVTYVGPDRGARLSPLYKIKSPNPNGAQTCKWTITSLDPDKPTSWTGTWSVPQGS